MNKSEKEIVVQEIADILEKAKGIYITDFEGLNVEKMEDLRQKCREASVGYQVVKNTLARIAARKLGWEELVNYLQGPSAFAYSYDDPVAPARIITDFAEQDEKPSIKISIFEGDIYGPEKVKEIALLPSREILLSRVVGGFAAPIQCFVSGLNGLLQKFVMALDAVKELKEKNT